MSSPFSHGDPVPPDHYIVPDESIIKTIVERFLNSGLSTAIVSERRFGKTSMLNYLRSPMIADAINSVIQREWHHMFYYINVHELDKRTTDYYQLWKKILDSIIKDAGRNHNRERIFMCVRTCEKDGYDITSIEELFKELKEQSIRLVMMIDEFDDLLNFPEFRSGEFFAGLRSLTTHMPSIALIITTRLSIGELNAQSQFEHFGSPYFNYFHQFFLGPFSDKATQRLFSLSAGRFNDADKLFLSQITGRQPYLLQLAADLLWNAYEKGFKSQRRYEYVTEQLQLSSEHVFEYAWNHWSPETRKALIVIALNEVILPADKVNFESSSLPVSLQGFSPQIRRLQLSGFIIKSDKYSTGWEIEPQVFRWWMIDLLESHKRNNTLGQFLDNQNLNSVFTSEEKTKLSEFIRAIGGFAKLGIESFIKAAAEGFGKGISGN